MNRSVDYRVMIPAGLRFRLKHDEGDVSAENLSGSFYISIDEGDCRLKHINYQNCRVEVDEGKIRISHSRGDENSELRLYCDEGSVRLDSINGHQAKIEADEGRIHMERIRMDRLECFIEEGRIFTELILMPHARYEFNNEEGDIEIRLLNEAPIRIALFAEEGRIDSNLDLKIRRSDESEQARFERGKSADSYLKAFAEEGDIQLLQNVIE
jgi:hypothetical protein